MPILKIYGLPNTPNVLARLPTLTRRIQDNVADVPELGVTPEQVTVLYPADLMKQGLGEELIAESVGLFDKPERDHNVLQRLATAVKDALMEFARDNLPRCECVEVVIPIFDQHRGAYDSGKPHD